MTKELPRVSPLVFCWGYLKADFVLFLYTFKSCRCPPSSGVTSTDKALQGARWKSQSAERIVLLLVLSTWEALHVKSKPWSRICTAYTR